MSDKLIDENDLNFTLYDVLGLESLCSHDYFEEHSKETFDMTLTAAFKAARGLLLPGYQECDRQGVQFEDGKTTVPEPIRRGFRALADAGWIAPAASFEYGGQQLPMTLQIATGLIFNAANIAGYIYLEACFGTGHLIQTFGSDELIDRYVENLYAGKWSGTMALTEPQAGSSLADIAMTAEKAPDADYYRLSGTKCFITSGDHDITENIIHLTLARIKGAPAGVKGISLFVVPKYRIDEQGRPGESNDVTTIKIEHKMGLKASATALLNYGENNDCRGWLVGEENKGLAYMFQMMNEARIFAGVQGVSLAACAYQHALEYTRLRHQGRPYAERNPHQPPIPLIDHPDVKRMLLAQKAYVSGIITLVLFTTFCQDKARTCEVGSRELARWQGLYEILTPVCKAYGSDLSFQSVSLAMQCFGGYGYTTDFPVEQLLRDCRLFSIFEGANGIQAQDLLGRKVALNGGAIFVDLMNEIEETILQAPDGSLSEDLAKTLEEARQQVIEATAFLLEKQKNGRIDQFIAPASAYLEMFSQLVVGWMHLKRCVAAEKAAADSAKAPFYQGCLAAARYYITHVLPYAVATSRMLRTAEPVYNDLAVEYF